MPGIPSPPICDNEVVGALPINRQGQYLVFDREKEPDGAAFVAGHRDKHGTWNDALNGETREETGLTVVTKKLIIDTWTDNRCGRQPGPLGAGHAWMVFEVTVSGEVVPGAGEVRNPRWEAPTGIAALARRTIDYAKGRVSEAEWRHKPGLEPIWLWLLSAPGVGGWQLLEVGQDERELALKLSWGNKPRVTV